MSTKLSVHTKPEDEELAKKRLELAEIESQLADRELYVVTFRTELTAFERRYLKIVGARYAELDEINAEIAERLAQRRADKNVQDSAKQARARANESRSAIDAHAADVTPRSLPSQELKSLYREVAKRIHPDLSFDPEDRKKRQRLMAEANEAYGMGDIARLKRILEEYESSPEAVPGEGVGAELVRVIRKITQARRRLLEIEQEIQKLAASDLAKLKVKTEESAKRGRDLLVEMAEQVDRQIAAARQQASRMSTRRGSHEERRRTD
jgi:hypothetical protein